MIIHNTNDYLAGFPKNHKDKSPPSTGLELLLNKVRLLLASRDSFHDYSVVAESIKACLMP